MKTDPVVPATPIRSSARWAQRLGVGLTVLFFAQTASAQCASDDQCKGGRSCQDGACVDAEAPAGSPPLSTSPPRAAIVVPAPPTAAPIAPMPHAMAPTPPPPPPPPLPPLMKERNVPLLVVGLIFLGLSPFALVGGSAMVAEGKGDDKDIGVALQVIGGTTFGFGLAGTLAGIVPVNVESDAAFAEPAGAAALGPLSFGGSF